MATSIPKRTATVEDFVDLADSVSMSYDKLSLQHLIENTDISIVVFNVLDDYIDEIMDQTVEYEFTYDEYIKYYQSPKLLSNKLYNTTELDFIIMRINGIYDPKDFIMKSVRLIKKTTMNTIISQIYNANKKFIDEYNERNNE